MNYEQYHQKGGFYAIPVEMFDDLCEEKDELQKENQKLKYELEQCIAVADTNIELAESYYKENQKLKEQLQQKEDIIYKIKKCIEEKEEYYGDYMGDGNYTMYSMMGANNNRIPYIKSNLIKQILDNKGE